MPGLSDGASPTGISSRLRSSRTTGMSSLPDTRRPTGLKWHRGLTGRHARTVGRRLTHLNLLPAEKFPDYGHFEFERQGQAGRLFTCLDHPADDRQIDQATWA